ncbi:MAG TPA: Gfo/Idh/MocA family oxidoreductase [Candidatus Krumholzibacteria bacterium]|nr:Gfo/Idh/MocA family oxidoreductase [Candidatus Krumholzibacteria bacterium]
MGLRLGVAGTGRLGRAHVRVLRSLDGVDFVGCCDADAERARAAADEFGATAFPSLDAMLAEVDAVSIVTSTSAHADVALATIAAGRDLFIEKPITATVPQGEAVVRAARDAGRILQVGHIERFNGALEAVLPRVGRPMFIEVHRLAPFTPRGADVSVVMDLMIHDLDLLGLLVGGAPVDIRAKGAALLTGEPDIVNARLEYADGCVANVTASRITASPMRKVRVFSTTGYYSIDLLGGSVTHYRKSDAFAERMAALQAGAPAAGPSLADFVAVERFQGDGLEPLAKELAAFRRAVAERSAPPVTGEAGLAALRLASAILERVGPARM